MKKAVSIFLRLPFSIIASIRSYFLSLKVSGNGRIKLYSPFLPVTISKGANAKIEIAGTLKIVPHLKGRDPVLISMGNNSQLKIDGDFIIGNGVKIVLSDNARLYIGGKKKESESGITSQTLIMVYDDIYIGSDLLCAWDVFITDSDWHHIEGQEKSKKVRIGDHVWIAHKSSILKGSQIGEGCVVASHSKLAGKEFPGFSLIGGTPARILKDNIIWGRDLR